MFTVCLPNSQKNIGRYSLPTSSLVTIYLLSISSATTTSLARLLAVHQVKLISFSVGCWLTVSRNQPYSGCIIGKHIGKYGYFFTCRELDENIECDDDKFWFCGLCLAWEQWLLGLLSWLSVCHSSLCSNHSAPIICDGLATGVRSLCWSVPLSAICGST